MAMWPIFRGGGGARLSGGGIDGGDGGDAGVQGFLLFEWFSSGDFCSGGGNGDSDGDGGAGSDDIHGDCSCYQSNADATDASSMNALCRVPALT